MNCGNELLKDGEKLVDLGRNGLRLIQNKDVLGCGTDSVLLSDFVKLKKGMKTADLGTGSGVLSILMCARCDGITVDAIDIDEAAVETATRNVMLNSLESRISVQKYDIRNCADILPRSTYDTVICNPPYFDKDKTLLPEGGLLTARTEDLISIDDICAASSKLLKSGGRLCCVYPAPKMLILMQAMRANRIEPKRVRLVQNNITSKPKIVLMDGVKDGGEQLDWLPVLLLTEMNGEHTAEYNRIYNIK